MYRNVTVRQLEFILLSQDIKISKTLQPDTRAHNTHTHTHTSVPLELGAVHCELYFLYRTFGYLALLSLSSQ